MNIKQAKQEIKNAMIAYFSKNEFGEYELPIERQRPVFLMGPPGIGKTAIMEQIAQELNVGIVSYSMTHHTRQSALGLPYITHKNYGGEDVAVSEYTMSEIIASVYDCMEETGLTEGILFLDEINCVSETLAPSMLQFLQYKIFGRHRVPDGWIVVTAGNPPEYNNSVREFDVVTWDRLKRIDVEPDYTVWKEYAINHNIHSSILSYLDTKTSDFYKVESTADGKAFATARGWEDLSRMIELYEKKGIPVERTLIEQYIQEPSIARSFASYYRLFVKYRSQYDIDAILAGNATDALISKAASARFDERLAILGLLLESVFQDIDQSRIAQSTLRMLRDLLKQNKSALDDPSRASAVLASASQRWRLDRKRGKKSGTLSPEQQSTYASAIREITRYADLLQTPASCSPYQTLSSEYNLSLRAYRASAAQIVSKINHMFLFAQAAFGEGQELAVLVTELTRNQNGLSFLAENRCDEYLKYNKRMLFDERRVDLLTQMDALGL